MTPTTHEHGFVFGAATVTALAAIERRSGAGEHVVIRVQSPHHTVDIYVSPTGRSVRVFRDHAELTPTTHPEGNTR